MLKSLEEKLYGYRDVTILPTPISNISSRSECNPFIEGTNYFPIFTAPMTSVVGEKSYEIYKQNHITPILPRSIDLKKRKEYMKKGEWIAVSLKEFDEIVEEMGQEELKICIDIANGHMKSMLDKVKEAKEKNPNLVIMAGNIANPFSIVYYSKAGVDYVRLGIGGGSGCITTSNTSIGCPMASLISETRRIREELVDSSSKEFPTITKIIADGGIRGYGDVMKALALGADYVMIGGLFAECLEAEGDFDMVSKNHKNKIDPKHTVSDFNLSYSSGHFYTNATITSANTLIPGSSLMEVSLMRYFYGMASRAGQEAISGKATKTAEGISKTVPITITIPNWAENMSHYLRSNMSYLGITKISNIFEESEVRIISTQAAEAINK